MSASPPLNARRPARPGSSPAPTARSLERALRELGDPRVALFLQGFFKTRPGEYGEGDRFLGIRVPVLRKLARSHRSLPLRECKALLRSPYHEARLLALLILVGAYDRGDAKTRAAVYRLYLDNTDRVNNWDLVDSSAPQIVGRHLEARDRSVLLELARSDSVWERRIATLATFHFIRRGEHEDALRVAELLLADRHDLIHKAVGWTVREIGNRDRTAAERFLRMHYREMPRTMLRYAIEKLPEPLRRQYLKGEIRATPRTAVRALPTSSS